MPGTREFGPRDTQPQIERLIRGRTRIFAVGLMVLDLLSFIAHQGWLNPWAHPLEKVLLAMSFLGLIGLVVWLERLRPLRLMNTLGGLATLLAVAAILLHLATAREVRETTHLMLVVAGAGCFLYSLPWLALNLGVALGGWSYLAWTARPGESWSYFATELLAASLLGLLLHVIWRNHLRRFHQLLVRDARHADTQQRTLDELQQALARIKTLRGLVPICSSCKKIRDDKGYWHQVEAYVHEHSQASFTHGLCPNCADDLRAEFEAQTRVPQSLLQ